MRGELGSVMTRRRITENLRPQPPTNTLRVGRRPLSRAGRSCGTEYRLMGPCGNSGWDGAPSPRTDHAALDGSESKQNRREGMRPILVRGVVSLRACVLWQSAFLPLRFTSPFRSTAVVREKEIPMPAQPNARRICTAVAC